MGGHLFNTFLLVAALALTAWWASGGRPVRLRGQGALGALARWPRSSSVLLLGISGAVTALGDTLFPVDTLAEGSALTFSPTAHVFVRLRVWHPALAVAVGLLAGRARARRRARAAAAGGAALRARPGRRSTACSSSVGVLNVWLLAPVALQLVHLLLSDGVWIALVLMAAAALAE